MARRRHSAIRGRRGRWLGLNGGVDHATQKELEGIDRGLKASREGRLATDAEVEAVFAKHRRA
jgi:predicted transcriptional regulator